jgi:hypothetical protein
VESSDDKIRPDYDPVLAARIERAIALQKGLTAEQNSLEEKAAGSEMQTPIQRIANARMRMQQKNNLDMLDPELRLRHLLNFED